MKSFIYFLLVLLTLLYACTPKEQSFDKEKWNIKVLDDYRYRDSMLKDVLENQLREGDSYQSIIDRLGEPDNNESPPEGKTLWYEIKKINDDAETSNKMKTLFIDFGTDSLMKNARVEEWKFK